MSTVKKPLKYLWRALFKDGHVIEQPEDDRYSKHDDNEEWNPSSFRDILEYNGEIEEFALSDRSGSPVAAVYPWAGIISLYGVEVDSTTSTEPKKLIYYRDVEADYVDGEFKDANVVAYNIGYEYKDKDGKNIQRILRIE